MKLMKKIVAVALTGVMALSVFAGCGAASNKLIDALNDKGYDFEYDPNLSVDAGQLEKYYEGYQEILADCTTDLAKAEDEEEEFAIEVRASNELAALASQCFNDTYLKAAIDNYNDKLEDLAKVADFTDADGNVIPGTDIGAVDQISNISQKDDATGDDYEKAKKKFNNAVAALPICGIAGFTKKDDDYEDLKAADLAAEVISSFDGAFSPVGTKIETKVNGGSYYFGYKDLPAGDKLSKTYGYNNVIVWVALAK